VSVELTDVKGLSEMLGISEGSVWRGVLTGKVLKPVRIGRSVRWRKREVQAWVEAGCPVVSKWTWPGAGRGVADAGGTS